VAFHPRTAEPAALGTPFVPATPYICNIFEEKRASRGFASNSARGSRDARRAHSQIHSQNWRRGCFETSL